MALTFHPLAELLPLLEGAEFDDFVADAAAHGIREPIWIYKGQILDGRNRWLAAQQLGIKCPQREYNGKASELLAFVISMNLKRRQLSESQLALVAARIASFGHGGDRRSDQAANLPLVSQADAAKRVGVSERSVRDAVKVLNEAAPEVLRAVENGGLVISVAAQLADEPPAFQKLVVGKIVSGGAATSADAIRQVRKAEAEAKLNSIEAMQAKELAGVYDVVVIDPPWAQDKIERDTRPEQVSWGYPVMSPDEIADEVGSHLDGHLADDAHVFLWTTQRYLPVSFSLIAGWGLVYGGFTMTWSKNGGFQPFDFPQFNSEFVVYARKGSPKFLDTKKFSTCFYADRCGHGNKPEEFYDTLRRVTGGRKLDMYNRRKIAGFDGWGKEAPASD